MTPKEKAIELVDKMFIEMSNFSITDEVLEEVAKQCALISVNECINIHFNLESDRNGIGESFKYWQEVKQEIINL
jgi:hypothetical protein